MKLAALRPGGAPERKFFDTEKITGKRPYEDEGKVTFSLKCAQLPKLEDRRKASTALGASGYGSTLGMTPSASAPTFGSTGGFAPSGSASPFGATKKNPFGFNEDGTERVPKRAEKYLHYLMRAHDKREEANQKAAVSEEKDRDERKALLAKKFRTRDPDRPNKKAKADSDSDRSDKESDEESDDEIDGDLVPYDGYMKVDVELVVMRAPGFPEPSTGSEITMDLDGNATGSRAGGSHAGSRGAGASSGDGADDSTEASTPRMDMAEMMEELAALQEEVGPLDNDDLMPDDPEDKTASNNLGSMKVRGLKNIWDTPVPPWHLAIGGTMFFVPDAERYSVQPSLPPPPPPSLQGRRRIRIKPRLPLDISHGRWRDEYPVPAKEPSYAITEKDRLGFEEKMKTFDFYVSCNNALQRLPKPKRASDKAKHITTFGELVARDTRRSQAWTQWNHREALKKEQEAFNQAQQKEKQAQESENARIETLLAEQKARDAAMEEAAKLEAKGRAG